MDKSTDSLYETFLN